MFKETRALSGAIDLGGIEPVDEIYCSIKPFDQTWEDWIIETTARSQLYPWQWPNLGFLLPPSSIPNMRRRAYENPIQFMQVLRSLWIRGSYLASPSVELRSFAQGDDVEKAKRWAWAVGEFTGKPFQPANLAAIAMQHARNCAAANNENPSDWTDPLHEPVLQSANQARENGRQIVAKENPELPDVIGDTERAFTDVARGIESAAKGVAEGAGQIWGMSKTAVMVGIAAAGIGLYMYWRG